MNLENIFKKADELFDYLKNIEKMERNKILELLNKKLEIYDSVEFYEVHKKR